MSGLSDAVAAEGGDADALASVHQGPKELDELRVIGDGGPHEAHPECVGRHVREERLGGHQPHAPVRGPSHHAERAAAMTAALPLDEEHVVQLRVRRHQPRARRQQHIRRLRHRREPLPVHVRDVPAGEGRDAVELAGVEEALHRGHDGLFGLPEEHRIHHGGAGQRVREGERPAEEDAGVALVAVAPQRGDAGEIEHVEEAGQLELIGHGHGDEREGRQRRLRLHRQRREARLPVGLDVVRQEHPLHGEPSFRQDRRHPLVPERRHPGAVRRRVQQGDAAAPLGRELRALLGLQPGGHRGAEGTRVEGAGHTAPIAGLSQAR